MGRLIYVEPTSLDGFIGDGDYSWGAPDEKDEALAAMNADFTQVSTHIYGRRMYETMAVWETMPSLAERTPEAAEFAAAWQAAEKVVFSTTLRQTHTHRTRIERHLDAQVLAELKATSSGDLTIGGPTLAAEAMRLDLVDVVQLIWHPVLLGGGIPVLSAGVRRELTLREERRFANGVVKATYDVR